VLERTNPASLSEAEVLDHVLDRGIVIDALSHVSVAGTELITVRSHMVVASIQTYLRYFAEDAGVENPRPSQSEPCPRRFRQTARVIDFPAFLPD
jgi:gas vesicle structural protein